VTRKPETDDRSDAFSAEGGKAKSFRVIDVRSSVQFEICALPTSHNIPMKMMVRREGGSGQDEMLNKMVGAMILLCPA
jgi:rhodanese-related sulfurtransferase